MRRVPAANIATAAGGDIHRERRKTLHNSHTVRPRARRDVVRIGFAGLVREIASAASTEAGAMLGFAQVFVLFSRLFLVSSLALLADRMVCDGGYPTFWKIYRCLELN
jgi:hypothetical protein